MSDSFRDLSGEYEVKCRVCEVAAELIVEEGDSDRKTVVCPRCDAREDYDVVLKSVNEQLLNVKKKEVSDVVREVFSGNPDIALTHTPDNRRKALPKFVIDIE